MKFSIQKLPKAQLEILIEISNQEFQKFSERATLDLGESLSFQGFRPGRIPREIVEKEIGQEKILNKAVEMAIKESYLKVILENEIEPIGSPEITILWPTTFSEKKSGGLNFKVKVSVLPQINLPDYKEIASQVKRKEISVKEKEIEEAILWLQKSRAKFSLKNSPAQKGDFVEIEYSSPQLEGNKIFQDAFILGEGRFIPGFEENLEKMEDGEEKFFSIPNFKGQKEKLDFKVRMKSVQKMELPEISDQWAKSLGKFENLEALKKSIKEGINLEKEVQESQRIRKEILNKISEKIEFEIPEILIELERNRTMEELKRKISQDFQISFGDYLAKIKKSEKEIRELFLPQIQERIKNFLILREIAKRENIQVFKEEVRDEINKILKNYPDIETAKKNLDLEKLKLYIEGEIRNEKTLARLESYTT